MEDIDPTLNPNLLTTPDETTTVDIKKEIGPIVKKYGGNYTDLKFAHEYDQVVYEDPFIFLAHGSTYQEMRNRTKRAYAILKDIESPKPKYIIRFVVTEFRIQYLHVIIIPPSNQ
jgi:hypothetical protein